MEFNMTNLLHYRVQTVHNADIVPAAPNSIPVTAMHIVQGGKPITTMKQDDPEEANKGIEHPVSGTCQHIIMSQRLCSARLFYFSEQENKELNI